MSVTSLFARHAAALAETENLSDQELSDGGQTDEAACAAAYGDLLDIENEILLTPSATVSEVYAKVTLAMSYAKDAISDAADPCDLPMELQLLASIAQDLAALSAIQAPGLGVLDLPGKVAAG